MGQGCTKSSYFHDLSKVEFTPAQKALIQQQIRENPVMVYSKDYCPHCISAKKVFRIGSVPAKVREINLEEDGLVTQAILYNITGQKTVPSIFIRGQHIGGNSDLKAMAASGELIEKLEDAGIPHSFPV